MTLAKSRENLLSQIMKFDEDSEFLIPEGCHIIELSNSESDPGVSIARARVEPGVTTEVHWLEGTWERYVILEGRGEVELDGGAWNQVGESDVVLIPPDCRQRIRNTGSKDLIFLAICSPRFNPDCYRS